MCAMIGERIRLLREKAGLTQLELSKKLNVKRETINQWENETRDLKTASIIAISNFFDVPTDYLLGTKGYTSSERVDIGKLTGLSERNIELLERFKNKHQHNVFKMHMMNDFLQSFFLMNELYYLRKNGTHSEMDIDFIDILCNIRRDVSENLESLKNKKNLLDLNYTELFDFILSKQSIEYALNDMQNLFMEIINLCTQYGEVKDLCENLYSQWYRVNIKEQK